MVGLDEEEHRLGAIRDRFPGRRLVLCYPIRDVLSIATMRHARGGATLLDLTRLSPTLDP